jgi:hypothetical protein
MKLIVLTTIFYFGGIERISSVQVPTMKQCETMRRELEFDRGDGVQVTAYCSVLNTVQKK